MSAWVGWLAIDGTWQRVCHAEDMGVCARKLGRIGTAQGVPARHQALTGGHKPPWLPPVVVQASAPSPEQEGSLADARKCYQAAQALEKAHDNVSAG